MTQTKDGQTVSATEYQLDSVKLGLPMLGFLFFWFQIII